MTMHLVGPWLTTTGKRRGKSRYRNADVAARARHNREEWQRLLDKYKVADTSKRQVPVSASNLPATPSPYRRDTGPRIPSVDTGQGTAAAVPSKQYTGTLIKGIATMHKSNAVPIIDEEQAIAVAHMRR